jgi:hypothetical protein
MTHGETPINNHVCPYGSLTLQVTGSGPGGSGQYGQVWCGNPYGGWMCERR